MIEKIPKQIFYQEDIDKAIHKGYKLAEDIYSKQTSYNKGLNKAKEIICFILPDGEAKSLILKGIEGELK